MVNPVIPLCEAIPVSIAGAASLTPAQNFGGKVPVGIYMSPGWTAASLTFQASLDGVTWYDVYSSDVELQYQASAAVYISIDNTALLGCPWFRVRSGTSAVPVPQAVTRDLVVMGGRPSE